MGKKARQNRRANARAGNPRREATPRDLDLRLWVIAGVAAIAVVGIVVVAFVASGAFASGGPGSLPPGTQTFAEPNHSHVPGTVTYDRVPPAGGAHNATQLNCGVYTAPVQNENAVHSLEHGAVWITYQPTLPADQVAVLQQMVTSHYVGTERYLILSPYAGLSSPIVASAWGAQLSVDQASDSRLVDFIHLYAGSGQGGEPGGPCTGGVGSPVE
ncbi:MAG: DUF3105 domain-containing protein [Candidatus Limnocylindrales bacterium]